MLRGALAQAQTRPTGTGEMQALAALVLIFFLASPRPLKGSESERVCRGGGLACSFGCAQGSA